MQVIFCNKMSLYFSSYNSIQDKHFILESLKKPGSIKHACLPKAFLVLGKKYNTSSKCLTKASMSCDREPSLSSIPE